MLARFISSIIAIVSLLIGIFATTGDALPFGLSIYKRPSSDYTTGGSDSTHRIAVPPLRPGWKKSEDPKEKSDEMVRLITSLVDGKNHTPVYKFDDLGTLPYSESLGLKRMGCHAGQRKLLLTEIEFLTCCAANSNFIIYAGSAPCEKLPALLQMFPDKKFLLVDPNFHSFHAPDSGVQIVYQNVDRVSSETLANTRKDMKLANRPHLSSEDRKRLMNIKLQDHPAMYRQTYTGDMSLVADRVHADKMREIQREFETKNYKELAKDIILSKGRVYIIQDYLTEALCRLIYESIKIADAEFKSPTRICFISDLRSNFFETGGPIDLDFIWNDALQLIFLKLLQPDFSMLKFHPPYMSYDISLPLIEEMESGSTRYKIFPVIAADLKTCKDTYGIDFLKTYKSREHKHEYLKSSNIWLQAWGPTASSEARLIISKADVGSKYQVYDARLWDDKFQYSKMMRSYAYYGALYESIRDMLGHTYDGCYDCAIEILILLNYAFRTQAPSSETTMNVPKLIEILKTPNGKSTLIALKNQIDSIVVYSNYMKCFFHGQLTKPLKSPIFYEHEYDLTGKNWVNQLSVTGSTVERKKIITYDCSKKPPGFVVLPDTKLSLGKNVREIPERDADRYIKSGFAYCKGEH